MPAATTDLHIEQGVSWSKGWQPQINGTPFLDGTWTVRAQVRASYTAEDILHEWSTAAGNAEVIDEAAVISVDPDESTAWTWDRGVYDLEVSKAGVTYRVAGGRVRIEPEVTRD